MISALKGFAGEQHLVPGLHPRPGTCSSPDLKGTQAPILPGRRPPVPPDKPSSCPHHVHTDVARASLWNSEHPGL